MLRRNFITAGLASLGFFKLPVAEAAEPLFVATHGLDRIGIVNNKVVWIKSYTDANQLIKIQWYVDGKLHRLDGPAIEKVNGDKHWYVDNKLHRLDGPALEFTDGDKLWYVDGKLHRVDGPAIEKVNGDKHWYIDGKFIECTGRRNVPMELNIQ